ncbi:MAG: hypothetical protein D6751_07200 [Deltaproteobacteria bacterium]|nr:MAG: hypothetical protein D6751_07200 [Deltaproteobacteria bacterium]
MLRCTRNMEASRTVQDVSRVNPHQGGKEMKKVLILLVAAALLASPAFGAVRNSKHDLSSSSTGASIKSDNVDEVCVFCHTPHAGITGKLAPLWNRTAASTTLNATDLYNSVTLEAGSKPSAVSTEVNNSDAPLCLSCHDGASLAGGLANPPASNGNNQPTFTGTDTVTGDADIMDGTAALTNDHPIGMDYSVVDGTDNGGASFQDESGTAPNLKVGSLPLYGTNGVMWCSTCHDVHNEGAGQPFLNISNAGSALCTTCHVK